MMPNQKLGIDKHGKTHDAAVQQGCRGASPRGMPIGIASRVAKRMAKIVSFQRRRHALHDQFEGGRARAQRIAQIQRGQPHDVAEILFVERLVKAQFRLRLRHLVGGAPR